MSKKNICDFCGKPIDGLPFTCKFCGGKFCSKHRLPEEHNCPGLKEYKEKVMKGESSWFKEKKVEKQDSHSMSIPIPSYSYKSKSSFFKWIIAILIIFLVVLVVIFNFGVIDKLISNANYSIEIPSSTPSFDVNIKRVWTSPCFRDSNTPCTLVDIEIKNNLDHSENFMLKGYSVVFKDGTQKGILTGIGGFGVGLIDKCYYPLEEIGGTVLYPNAKKTYTLCFSHIKKENIPIFYLTTLHDFDVKETSNPLYVETIGGEEREYEFNLTNYLSD